MDPAQLLSDPWFVVFAPVGLVVVVLIWYLIEGN